MSESSANKPAMSWAQVSQKASQTAPPVAANFDVATTTPAANPATASTAANSNTNTSNPNVSNSVSTRGGRGGGRGGRGGGRGSSNHNGGHSNNSNSNGSRRNSEASSVAQSPAIVHSLLPTQPPTVQQKQANNVPLSFAAAAAAKEKAANEITEKENASVVESVPTAAKPPSGSKPPLGEPVTFKPNVAQPPIVGTKVKFGSALEESSAASLSFPSENKHILAPVPKAVQSLSTYDTPRVKSAPPSQESAKAPAASNLNVSPKVTPSVAPPSQDAAPTPSATVAPITAPAPTQQPAEEQSVLAAVPGPVPTAVAPNMPPQIPQYSMHVPQHGHLPPHAQPMMVPGPQQMPPQMYAPIHSQQGYVVPPFQQGGFVPRASAPSHGRPPSGPGMNQFGSKGNYKGQQQFPPNMQPGGMPVMAQPGVAMSGVQGFYPQYAPQYPMPYGGGYDQQSFYYAQGAYPQPVPFGRPMIPPMTSQSQPTRYSQPPSPGGTIPPPSSAPFPTAAPLVQTPKKSTAIRITNPLTKQEVKLPTSETKSASNTPVPASGVLSVPLTPLGVPKSPVTVAAVTPATPKVEGAAIVAALAAVIATPAAVVKEKPSVVLKDAQGHIISFIKSAKAADGVETIIQDSIPEVAAVTPVRAKSPEGKRAVSPKPAKAGSRAASPAAKPVSRTASPSREAAKDSVVVMAESEPVKEFAKPKSRTPSPSRTPAESALPKTPEPNALPTPEAEAVKTVKSPVVSPAVISAELKPIASPTLEEGEIPEPQGHSARQDSRLVTSPRIACASVDRPVLKHECRVLDSFDDQVYPEGLPRPTNVPHLTYAREFLLAFKAFNIAPIGLPPMEFFTESEPPRRNTVRQASGPGAGGPPQRQQSYKGFKGTMPTVPGPGGPSRKESTSQFGNPRRMDSRDGGKGGRGGKNRNNSMMSQQSANEPYVEPIKASGAGWAPETLVKKKVVYESEEAAIEAHENEVVKKAKGLLNKLTIEKFDSISGYFLELPITNQTILKKIIALIFDKALDEHFFQNMYGRLCQRLSNDLPKIQTWIDMDQKNNIFRRLLLNKCQEEFESSEKWTKDDQAGEESRQERLKRLHNMTSEEKEKYAQDDYERIKLKRRVLGNVTFIGELFKFDMITEKIMHMCLQQLLREVTNPEEEEVESICKLMTTIGGRLDHEKGRATMDVYFARIKALSINIKLPSRIRFMLQDLLELRRNKWKARQEATGPMTIAEIHAAAEKKAKEEEAERAKSGGGGGRGGRGGGGRDDRRDRDRDDRRGGRDDRDRGGRQDRQGSGRGGGQDVRQQQQPSADGWNTVQTSSRRDDNFSNFGKTQTKKDVSRMQLGPQGGAWGKAGNSAGPVAAAKKDEGPKGTKNSFSILSHGDDRKEPAKGSSPLSAVPADEESAPIAPALTKEQATKKVEGAVEEWFSLFDVSEVIACHKELNSDDYNQQLLSLFINASLSKKPEPLAKTAKLITALLEAGCVSVEDVEKCLVQVAANLEDLSYDIPGVYKYFGTYFGALTISDDNAFPLKRLADILEPMIETPMRKPPIPGVLAATFDYIRESKGERLLTEIVRRQSVDLKVFWPEAKRTDEILDAWKADNNLACLDADVELEVSEPSELTARIETGDMDATLLWAEEVYDDAIRGSASFVKELTSSVLSYVGSMTLFTDGIDPSDAVQTRELFLKEEDLIKKHKPLFDLCLEGRENRGELELEVLLACQSYWSENSSVKDFLEHLFRIFTKLAIVDADAEQAWKENTEFEQASKAHALKELAAYFQSKS